MKIRIKDSTQNIKISFIRFDDVFGKVTAIKGWQYQTLNNKGV